VTTPRPPEISARAFADPEAFGRLRQYTLEAGGADAPALLYRIGFDRGWVDGLSISRDFSAGSVFPRFAGPGLPLLFFPSVGQIPEHFGGTLRGSLEATIHVTLASPSDTPVCHLSAGYAAGWYTAIFRDTILVLETECEARGDSRCHFEAQPARVWVEAGDSRALALLPYLDPPDPASHSSESAEEGEGLGAMMGQFDPLSPAVHVWGPVMVLPYSGLEDADSALEAVREDVGPDAVDIVIVDVTGVQISPLEACGLVELVSRLESRGIEVLVAGLRSGHQGLLGSELLDSSGMLVVGDLSEGIALAFQMATLSRGNH
jgi:hypothetical protein